MHFIGYTNKAEVEAMLGPVMAAIQKAGLLFRIIQDPWGALMDVYRSLHAAAVSA